MGAAPPSAVGTVQSVDASSDTFTLKEASNTTVTVAVSGSTTYVDPGVTSPGLSDVVVGKQVAVDGTSASGTLTATSVMIGAPGGPFGHPGGPGGPPPVGAALPAAS
jgi:hypothetical protein